MLMIFTLSDEPAFEKNDCEKKALEAISISDAKKVVLHCDCTVISWEKVSNPQESQLIGALLLQWNITKDQKTFNQAD